MSPNTMPNAPSASPTDALRCPGEAWAGRGEDDGPDESGAAVVAFMGLAGVLLKGESSRASSGRRAEERICAKEHLRPINQIRTPKKRTSVARPALDKKKWGKRETDRPLRSKP